MLSSCWAGVNQAFYKGVDYLLSTVFCENTLDTASDNSEIV